MRAKAFIISLLISVSNLNAQVVDNVVYTIDKHTPSYLFWRICHPPALNEGIL